VLLKRPERHANTDIAGSAGDSVRHHAVQADDRKQGREEAEHRGKTSDHALDEQ